MRDPCPRSPSEPGRPGRSVVRQYARLGGLLAAALIGCAKAPPPPLPPIPATAGSLLMLPGGAPAAPSDPGLVDRVVAVVNGDPIMMSELQEAMVLYLRESKRKPGDPEDLPTLQRQVLTRMVNHRLQVQEARREKVEVTDGEVQIVVDDFVRRNGGDRAQLEAQLRTQGLSWDGLRREFRDQLLAQRIRGRRVGRATAVTDDEVERYLTENRGKLEAELKYRPRHIAILARPPDAPPAWARAEAEITALVDRLAAGEDFAELARRHSMDGSASAGGDLGWLARGEIQPLFEEAILKLSPGEVTATIKSTAGYHLFRLDEQEQLTAEMLAQLRQQGRELLLQRKAQARLDEWIESLRRRALISERL